MGMNTQSFLFQRPAKHAFLPCEKEECMNYCADVAVKSCRNRYEKEWPLPPGSEQRQVIYNVYHILNHHVLFGGGYLGQAQRMLGQILKMEG